MELRKRVIERLVVCGLDPALKKTENYECNESRPITSLELVNEPSYDSDIDKFLEINNRLYLKISYGGGRPPVSDIEFLTPDIEDDVVKLNQTDWTPVFVKGQQKISRQGVYKADAVNIRAFLQTNKSQQALVLCYKCDETCQMAVCDIDVLQGQRREGRRAPEEKQILNIPHGYKTVNHSFVIRNRNKYLIYKSMHSQLQNNYKACLLEAYPEESNPQVDIHSLPQFCFPQGIKLSEDERGFYSFSFILTTQSRKRIYCSCLVFKQVLKKQIIRDLNLRRDRKYYGQKALCIVSQYSYPDQYCQLLQQIYRIGMSKNEVPFFKVVQSLVDNLLMVSESEWGKVAIRYTYGGCKVIFQTAAKYPPVSDKSIYCLFKFLSVEKIINLFEAMLLQKHILLVSQSKAVLGLASQALLSILFPFKWQQTIIPVLPSSMRDYTQAPVPFVIGIPPNFTDIEYEKQSIIVNMDNNEIVNEESLPPMPDKPTKQLSKRLYAYQVYVRQHTKQFLQSPENRYIFEMLQQADSDNMNFDPYDIRDAFYQFLLTIMKNYSKFWKKAKKENRESSILGVDPAAKSIEQLYNVQDFLSDLNMTKVGSFGYKFSQTSIFSSFIENRVKDRDNQHYKFFEECLEAKKSKKQAKFITYLKYQKVEDCPYPKWQIEPGIQYSYDKLPSIMNPQRIRSSTDLDHIQLEMAPDTARYREESQKLRKYLEQKCVMCRGFYSIGLAGIHKDFGQSDWLPAYADLIGKLFIKNQVAPLIETIKKCSEGSGKAAAQTKILTVICDRFVEQERTVDRMIKGWDYTESQPRYRTHLVNLAGVPQKQLSQMHSNREVILGQHIFGDFQRIWFQKTMITFYICPDVVEDCRRLHVRIESQIMKSILNQILHRQLESFTRFVLQRYANTQVVVWTCEELMRFHQWLQ